MTDVVALVVLAGCGLGGLLLIPLGLPGLWVMAAGFLAYGWLTAFRSVSVASIALVVGLAFLGEIVESWLGFRLARRYGGSSRAGWGALLGGLVGAGVGVPIPVVGSVIGAFLGSFGGAALFEYARSRRADVALGAGWGAVLGCSHYESNCTQIESTVKLPTTFSRRSRCYCNKRNKCNSCVCYIATGTEMSFVRGTVPRSKLSS